MRCYNDRGARVGADSAVEFTLLYGGAALLAVVGAAGTLLIPRVRFQVLATQ